jgi:hypothetical protein
LCRYYEALHSRYLRNHFRLRVLLLASIMSGIGSMLEVVPGIVQLVAGGVVAVLMAWEFVTNYAKKAAVVHVIFLQCSDLEAKWRDLWLSVDDEDANDATIRRENANLSRRSLEVTGSAGNADIGVNNKLNEESTKNASTTMAQRYSS